MGGWIRAVATRWNEPVELGRATSSRRHGVGGLERRDCLRGSAEVEELDHRPQTIRPEVRASARSAIHAARRATLRDTETSAGLVALCLVCRAARHMATGEEHIQ